ncbi:ATPase, partial [Paenibacillus larvae]|uniref:ATPase n=1 Tax=Paenibacillus larvae TaxID=1464 RepID=UPI000BBD47FE
ADLEKIHRDNKNKKDKAYIAAQSRTKTLIEQLQLLPQSPPNLKNIQDDYDRFLAEIKVIDSMLPKADENNGKIIKLESQIEHLKEQRDQIKEQIRELHNEPIDDRCRACGQTLQGEAKAAAEADKQRRVDQLIEEFNNIITKRKELEAHLTQIEHIDVSKQREEVRELEVRLDQLDEVISNHKSREQLQGQIDHAETDEAAILTSLNESIFIIDAIKAFAAKEAEMMADKVQALFTTLSLRLFKTNKTDGEIKPDFEIEMDGKPYRKLSLSESIRAGLELRDVLSQQSGIIAPCMVDNAESITQFKQPNGQLIVSRVVPGQELTIEMEEEVNEQN